MWRWVRPRRKKPGKLLQFALWEQAPLNEMIWRASRETGQGWSEWITHIVQSLAMP